MGFIRHKEDFRCDKCGQKVEGDGFTDHCPKCLWGKHMDELIPGDRAATCRGLMEPVGALMAGVGWKISYKCLKCGKKYKVEAANEDNREEILKLGAEIIRQ